MISRFHERRIYSVTITVALALPTLKFTSGWVADSSDFGLLGSKVPENGRFPALDATEPPCKI